MPIAAVDFQHFVNEVVPEREPAIGRLLRPFREGWILAVPSSLLTVLKERLQTERGKSGIVDAYCVDVTVRIVRPETSKKRIAEAGQWLRDMKANGKET